MISMSILNGPWAGRSRTFTLSEFGEFICLEFGETADPMALFAAAVHHGWNWETDYSQASDAEQHVWFWADFVARVMRALERGLPVRFLGREYRAESADELEEVAGRLEDDIVESGRLISIDSDDENGVVVGVRGWEV
jgi:hypothetical protein